jgi:hypothetical protein
MIDLKSAFDWKTIEQYYLDRPVWVVYGHECFPQLVCAKLNIPPADGHVCIWGYSVYRRKPGFRTLGIRLGTFISEHNVCELYENQDEAIERLRAMTTPRV